MCLKKIETAIHNFEFDDQVFAKLLGDFIHSLGHLMTLHSTRRLLHKVKPGIIKNRSDLEATPATVSIFFFC